MTWPLMGYERNETRKWPGSSFTDAMRILALLHRSRGKGGAPGQESAAVLHSGADFSASRRTGSSSTIWSAAG